MRGISSLHLSGTRITDAGLTSLTGLEKCRFLFLGDTGVTDQGIALLSARYPGTTLSHNRSTDRKTSLVQMRESRNPKELKLSDPLLQDDDLIRARKGSTRWRRSPFAAMASPTLDWATSKA